MSDRPARSAILDPNCEEDLEHWKQADPRLATRIVSLIEATLEDPFKGIGKPEPLRGPLSGKWSRRINQKHRLVYTVKADSVYFLAARYHYPRS
jgi:toxin YoeB